MSGDSLVLVDMEEVAPHKSPETDECYEVISPPAPKKLKQACLPFKNMLSKPLTSVTPAKKRKRSSDVPLVMQKSPRVQRIEKCDDDCSLKVMAGKVCNTDNEVSSSSWNENTDCEKTHNYNGPKPRNSTGPLDSYLRTTQQREVSTSVQDDEVVDLANNSVDNLVKTVDDSEECSKIITDRNEDKENVSSIAISGSTKYENNRCDSIKDESTSDVKVCLPVCQLHDGQTGKASDKEKGDKQLTDMVEAIESESLLNGSILIDLDSSGECSDSLNGNALADSSIEDEVTPTKSCTSEDSTTPTSSDVTNSTPDSSHSIGHTTPVSSTKFKTPKSLNRKKNPETLRKIQEKEREKLEKLRQREEQRAEKERQKAEKEKQRLEEKEKKAKARLEKEREKQEQKELKEKERDEKLRQKEEERKKKQDILNAKKEEERKKKEDEKQKMEDEKNRKKQKESIQKFFTKRTSTPPKVYVLYHFLLTAENRKLM